MSLGSFLGLTVADPASAGFSVSGPSKNAADASTPDTDYGNSGQGSSAAYGLLPPDHELQHTEPGTGLQAPEQESSSSGNPRYDLNYIQRVVQGLGLDPHHFQFADGPGSAGANDVRMIPVGGSARSAPAAEGDPFELSVNPRNAAAFDLLSNIDPGLDFTGSLAAIRDIGDAGAYLNELGTKNAIDALKESMGRMAMNVPSEAQLGATPGYVKNAAGIAVPVYDQTDLLNRYRGALQMALLERQGTIELNHDNWTIKSIGGDKLTPEQFADEIRSRYQKIFSEGTRDFERQKQLSGGSGPLGGKVPEDLQRGIWADQFARRGLKDFLASIGVPEGPGQLISLDRWAYLPDGSGGHLRPDVLFNSGLLSRHVLDGKATYSDEYRAEMLRLLGGYYPLKVDTVEAITPKERILVPRRNQDRSERTKR